jgi:hypothetical protein
VNLARFNSKNVSNARKFDRVPQSTTRDRRNADDMQRIETDV